jgi:serine/threonine-protein kinase
MDRWSSLRSLLERALELPPEARSAWLEEQRQADPVLAAELESLLAEEAELDRRGFLNEAGREQLLGERPSLSGQRLGQYTLMQPLGQGGMGSVWLARRTDGRFEGEVAIKFLNLALLGQAGEARFRREGTLLARLTHPNIARLHDAGVAEAGQPYLVLERIDGRPIDEFCDQRGLTPLERVRLFHELLGAVAHAHANFVVHRDLKPSNILVTDAGVPKLLDFGIAKLLDDGQGNTPSSTLTESGLGAFTPEYAAPEQVLGEPISAATDVYSLGVLLYRLLAGRHPTSEGARTPGEHLQAIVDTDPARLSDAVTESGGAGTAGSPDQLRKLYLGDLDNILAKALRKRPGERYPTAQAMADDLGCYLRDEPVGARADSLGYRTSKFIRRHRAAVAAATVSLAALLLGTGFSFTQMLEARRQRDEARFQARRADAQLAFNNLVFSTVGDRPITMREILDKGRDLLHQEYVGEPRFTASISGMLARQYGEIGAYDAALAMLAHSDSFAALAGNSDQVLENSCHRAGYLSQSDQTAAAHALLDSLRPRLVKAPIQVLPECLVIEAGIFTDDQHADSAVPLARRGIALMEQRGDTAEAAFVEALDILANALENSHHRREALEVYQRLASLLDRTGRRETVSRNAISNNIGIALSNLGQLVEAEPVLRETAEQFRRTNPAHEVHPAIILNYARTLIELNRLDSAAVWSRQLQAQAVRDKIVGLEQTALFFLARIEIARGRFDEAAKAITALKALLPRVPRPHLEDVMQLEGMLSLARGRSAEGQAQLLAALKTGGYFEGRRGYGTRSLLTLAARASLEAGQPDSALSFARAADSLAAEDSLTLTRSAFVGEARLLEARALVARGDSTGARRIIGPALTALGAGAGRDHPLTREAMALQQALGGS